MTKVKGKILIVEDEKSMREVLRMLLEAETGTFTGQVAKLAVCIMIGLAVFGTCSYLTGSREFTRVVAEVKKGIGKK